MIANVPITLVQNNDYDNQITLYNQSASGQPIPGTPYIGTPWDLTGTTATMEIRQTFGSPLLLSISETANTNGSVLTLGGTAGTVNIHIAAADSLLITSNARYDLLLVDASGSRSTPIGGVVNYQPTITQ